MYVEYSANNSGGDWWLTDDDWKALEKAGWIVQWAWMENVYTDKGATRMKNGLPMLRKRTKGKYSWEVTKVGERYMGALAKYAYKPNCSTLREAADEFDRVTSQCSTDAGCACCGQPHDFTLYDDKGKYIKSGPSTEYRAAWSE
jgi:hypothetical protein